VILKFESEPSESRQIYFAGTITHGLSITEEIIDSTRPQVGTVQYSKSSPESDVGLPPEKSESQK
jgi:hypothetical protein